jgi:hypothetical protein
VHHFSRSCFRQGTSVKKLTPWTSLNCLVEKEMIKRLLRLAKKKSASLPFSRS